MDHFSYIDGVRAAVTSCLPCFTASPSNPSSNAANASLSESRPSSSNDLEHLLRDSDSDALSLHSNLGNATHRRDRRRRRSKFSLTLFGYTLFGRPPVYLSEDDEDGFSGRARALGTASSSTLDSDAAPLDASTIERLTSPDHFAALAAQRENERRQREVGEEVRRRAERRARRQERKARARAEALMSLDGTAALPDEEAFEGFQGSGTFSAEAVPRRLHPERTSQDGDVDELNASHSGDADDADLGGELYARKKRRASSALSASGSDSRSRTSASFSAGDASHVHKTQTLTIDQSIPYPHTEMHLPAQMRKKVYRGSKRTSTLSSVTSQSTSTAPYTPVESVAGSPAVTAFPVPQERYLRDGGQVDFPSAGLSGVRRPKLDPRAFLGHPT